MSLATFQNLIRSFNWHTPSWDLFILLAWLIVSVLYAFASGRGRILTILMSTYMSQLLVIKAPFLTQAVSSKLHIGLESLQQLALFGVLFLVFFVFLARYAFKTSADSHKMSALGFSLVFAFLQVGLLINIVIGYLPETIQSNFTPLIRFIFLQPNASFIWLILPVVFLIVLGRFVSDRQE